MLVASLEVLDDHIAPVRLVTYVPAPGTGTRKKMEKLLSVEEPLPIALQSA